MRRYLHIFICVLSFLITLTGCDNLRFGHTTEGEQAAEEPIVISDLQFDSDYKRFTIDIDSRYDLSDPSKLEVLEINQFGDTLSDNIAARVAAVSNNRVVKVAKSGVNKALIIADMTLDDEQVSAQRTAVSRLWRAFPDNHLYVSFMWSNSISKSVPVTQYILDNHFVSQPSHKLLLRSILAKIDEMSNRAPRYFGDISRCELWHDVAGGHKQLIVFSDGETYADNKPADQRHYQIQKQLSELSDKDGLPVVNYVNFGSSTNGVEDRDLSIELIVDRCNGEYYDTFHLNSLLSEVITDDMAVRSDYEITLENPDGRLFMGSRHNLVVNYLESDSVTYSGSHELSVGSVYNPVIVRGTSKLRMLSEGVFFALLLILLIYVALQFAVPYVAYQLFKRRYVTKYNGPGSATNGVLLGETCYYCKEKFEIGDEVVAKCKHTLHRDCWEENGHKCPDFGSRCPDGSHYYNEKNLFDPSNSSIYLKWIIAGVVAAALAWVCNVLFVNSYNTLPFSLLSIIRDILGDNHDAVRGGLVVSEFFGLSLAFFSSIYVSIFISRGDWLRRRIWQILLRAFISCLIIYLACGVSLIIYIAVNIEHTLVFIDWIPWVALGVGMAFVLSYRSPIDRSFAIKGTLVTVSLVLVSIYVWRFTDLAYFDTRVSQLITCVIYCIGLSITLATRMPTSQRYFLRVSGAIKDMDIAIYKWFSTPNNYSEVTVGKSVNSDICMSWDLSRSIAPTQLKLMRENGNLYIVAVDYGVKLLGKRDDLKIGIKSRIYHGEGFIVGRTKFLYIEMDV